MKIAVIGTGYVGLVAGTCFAESGNRVICVDVDADKVARLNQGSVPIFEPGLEELVRKNLKIESLRFTTSTADAVKKSEIIFLAVGTPPLADGSPDLKYLREACVEIGRAMDGHRLIVNKSTAPVGTVARIKEWVGGATSHAFDVASNPEFLKEGSALDDFLKPDRVILGSDSSEALAKLSELYAPFVRQGNPIFQMDPTSAEISKYACNAFLATKISFINEMALLCAKVGGNVDDVRHAMTSDQRIGKHFLYPGPGYGGSCFPKDVQALLWLGQGVDLPLHVSAAAEQANARQKKVLFAMIYKHFGGSLKGKRIGIWGLAFKPNTDDLRSAPALDLIDDLLAEGATVTAYDPVAGAHAKSSLGSKVRIAEDAYSALEGADALALVTEWSEFRQPDFERMKSKMNAPVIFDSRNVYPLSQMRKSGFKYVSLGRPVVNVNA